MANIRDVAALAGVSIASVSRILNLDPDYRATLETRERVLNAATQLGYEAKTNYKKRRQSSKISIACICRKTVEYTADSYYEKILNGAKKYLQQRNHNVDFVLSQFDIVNEGSPSSLFAHPPEGLLLMDHPDEDTMRFLSSKIKYIVGIDSGNPGIDNVCYDRFDAGCRAMRYLLQKGHTDIAYIGAHISENYTNVGRAEAYLRMMKQAKLPVDPDWMIDSKWHRGVCYERTIELMNRKKRPTALFVCSDYMAIAAMSALHEIGISVPDEISVIGISDIDDSRYLTPPLTTVAVPQTEIGEIAADILLQRIRGDRSLPKRIIVPTKIVERSSVASLKKE